MWTYRGVKISAPCIMRSTNIIQLSMNVMEKTPLDIVDWRGGLLDQDLRWVAALAGEGNTLSSIAESLCKAGEEGCEDKGDIERVFKSE